MKRFIYALLLILTPKFVNASMMGSSYFIEPSVGYRTETIKFTSLTNNASQIKMNTPTYGLKLGYRTALGIDFNFAGDFSNGKADWTPLEEKNNFTHNMVAFQLGINAMSAMKIYLGYAFMNELKVEKGLLNSDINLKGPAYQAGIQFRLFPLISVGAHYNLNQFTEISGSGYNLSDKVDSYFNKLDSQDYSFNLSLTF